MKEDRIKKIDAVFEKIASISKDIKKEIWSILEENGGDVRRNGRLKYPIKRGNNFYMIDYVFSDIFGEVKMDCIGGGEGIITEPNNIDEIRMVFGFIKESSKEQNERKGDSLHMGGLE